MKRLFFLAAFVTAAMFSNAQIKFGVKAGANFYKFSGDDADFAGVSPKLKVGFAGGGMVNIPVNSTFSVQPELLYSMEGTKYEEGGDKLLYKTDYINVPVLFQYNSSGFYAETGPQVGFLASAKISDGDNSEDVKDSFKSINFSWAIGLGYKMSSGFGIGARYNLGLANVIDSDEANIKLGGFHVGVFYLFGGK